MCPVFWVILNIVGLFIILDMNMLFPLPLLQSQLDPEGISHKLQLSTEVVAAYFPL